MMKLVKANCPEHGDVDLTTADLSVYVRVSDDHGWYQFVCPNTNSQERSRVPGVIGHFVLKSAEPRIIDVLVAAGVRLNTTYDGRGLEAVERMPNMSFVDYVLDASRELDDLNNLNELDEDH